MALERYSATQVQSASNLLRSCGIEPTIEHLQALAETAKSSYPNDLNGLEKAARGMVGFFAGQPTPVEEREFLSRLIRWAISLLRIKSVGILPSRNS